MTILDSPSAQTGRLLVLGASAIYGTNFATVKLLDDSMPLSISAALRFGLASSVVSALVIGRESDDVDAMVEKERNLAFWSGAEVGLWYSIGYLAQAEGLQTVAAGKVRFGVGKNTNDTQLFCSSSISPPLEPVVLQLTL